MPTSRSIAHSHATKVALQHGARVLSMTAFTPDMMYAGGLLADSAKKKPICDEVARRLGAACRAHLTTRGGTDLRLNLEGRPGNSHACIVRRGEFSAVPNIEANISPVDGSAEGVIVVDGSIPNFSIGLITTPIRLTVKVGNIASIDGGDQARRLEDLLRAWVSRASTASRSSPWA